MKSVPGYPCASKYFVFFVVPLLLLLVINLAELEP